MVISENMRISQAGHKEYSLQLGCANRWIKKRMRGVQMITNGEHLSVATGGLQSIAWPRVGQHAHKTGNNDTNRTFEKDKNIRVAVSVHDLRSLVLSYIQGASFLL